MKCEQAVDDHPEKELSTKKWKIKSPVIHILEIPSLSGCGGWPCEQTDGYQETIQRVFHKLSPNSG